MNKIEVCFSPLLYPHFENPEANVVVVDILRATSSICTAFKNGAEKIIPVSTLEEAEKYKEQNYIVAAERDGEVVDFADFGNSPHNFTEHRIKGKAIVYSTTNGTNTIKLANNSNQIIIGAFNNISAVCRHLMRENRDVLILCAGWKKKFNLEDTLFAGALAECLIHNHQFDISCDSTMASLDLWSLAKHNVWQYVQKINWRKRLALDEVIEYCLKMDITDIIPVYANEEIVKYT